jgi:chloramphenicol 3-O phosphotransferase
MNHGGPQVLLLNGGSSSGKSTLARRLQEVLPGCWLRLGVDTLIDALPQKLFGPDGLELADDGSVGLGPDFAEAERRWRAGVAAMAKAGAHLLVEDNFVSGPIAQRRWREALRGLAVGWLGVRCAAHVAAAREQERGDRIAGMAARQAGSVHRGIDYDLVVDTGTATPDELAQTVRAYFFDGVDGRRA